MRIYSADSLETLHAREFLAEGKAEGFLTDAQYQQLEQEMKSDLRTTNLFLRIVLFLFTILCVAAAAALFFVLFKPPQQADNIALFLFTGICYGAAEYAASELRFYRHGIEEALTLCFLTFLCAALESTFGLSAANPHNPVSLIAAAGALFSLWIWHRFGIWYAFLLAMILVVYLPADWTSSPSAHRVIVAAFYAAGLFCLAAIRSRHRSDDPNQTYSLAEALLWLGIYLSLNLKTFAWSLPGYWFGGLQSTAEFGKPFYWTTWLLIWCLPPVILARGIRLKDRFLLAAGAVAALLTLIANKPYLGWPRHTWDPMLLGILLTGAALYLRRWLQQAPGGVRHGFTAARLSKKDTYWVQTGASALGFLSPQSILPAPQTNGPDLGLDGGASGGGGATRDF